MALSRWGFEAGWGALALAYSASVVIGVAGWLAGPRLGVSVDFKSGAAVVTRVHPGLMAWEAGVRPGDLLRSIDGSAVSPTSWLNTQDRGREFRAESGATGKILEGSAGREAASTTIGMIGLEVVALSFAAMSLFVIARTRRTTETRRFSYFALVAAIALALAPAALQFLPLAVALEALAIHWVPVSFVAFFLVFGRDPDGSADPSGGRLLAFLAVAAVSLDTLWALATWTNADLYSITRPLGLLFLAGGLLGGVGLLLRRYLRAQSKRFQEQLRIVTTGTALGILPFVVLSLVPFAVRPYDVVRPELAVFTAALIPLSFGYAVMRHELMGLRYLVHRGVAYALITLAVLIVYGFVIAVVREIGDPESGLSQRVEIGLFLLLAGGVPLISSVRRGAFAIVDLVLYKHSVDYPDVLRKVTLNVAVTSEFHDLLRGIFDALRNGLGLTFAAYVNRVPAGAPRLLYAGHLEDSTVSALTEQELVGQEEPADIRRAELPGVDAPVLLAFVPGPDSRHGLLCLGPKSSDEPFSQRDYQIIRIVTGLMSTGIGRLQLLDELQAKTMELTRLNALLLDVQEEERKTLAAFLHDSPLQKLSYAFAQSRHYGVPARTLRIMREVVDELRNVSSSLSPTILDDFGLVRSLDQLCNEARSLYGFDVSFNYEGLSRNDRYPQGIELATYRIAQEALTNCQKHSKATWVRVLLRGDHDCIAVTIEDNGIGLRRGQAAEREPTPRLGFRTMRQRAEQLHGNVVIADRHPSGVRVHASLPIQLSMARSDG